MKNRFMLACVLAGAALAAACAPPADDAGNHASESAPQTAEAPPGVWQPISGQREYTFAERDVFIVHMRAKLAVMERNLDVFSARIESSDEEVREESRRKLDALRKLAARLSEQVAAAQGATAVSWNGVKVDTQRTYDAMKAGFAEARQ